MMVRTYATLAAALAFAVSASPARAQGSDAFCTQAAQAPVTKSHVTAIDGQSVAYNSTAGFLHVTAADGNSHACIFYTAYQRTDIPAGTTRPLGFAFNGGPGSASLWLHLGVLGPKRVDTGPNGLTPVQPFSLIDNQSSFLDVMDLVMIDPVATGFSRPDAGVPGDKFFGVKNDYQSIASFVQTYLTQYNRWASPKFIIGESYGGIRASLLTNYLQRNSGINVAGIIFVSPWLTTATTNFADPANDLAYVAYLPTYATSAWYHHKLGSRFAAQTLDQVRVAAEDFAFGPYMDALALGNDLSAEKAALVAQTLADLTGLPLDYITENNLRVTDEGYFANLLALEHKRVGRFDTRFTEGTTGNPTTDAGVDPSDTVLSPAYTAAMNDYLLNDLAWSSPSPYVTSANLPSWPFESDAQEYGVMDQLSAALLDNPQLHVYVAAGFYDLAVPFGTTKYNFRHLAPGQGLDKRVAFGFFEAGHMVYTNPACLVRFKAGVKEFVTKTLAPPPSPVPNPA